MPPADLERRLSAAFDAFGEPELSADQRGALVPALRRRRARRQRLASGVGVVAVLAGLATGLGLGLGSAPMGPVALPAPAICVEVQIGTTQSCRGTLVLSGRHSSGAFAAPLAPAGSRVPASAGGSSPSGSAQPVGVTVGARLVIVLPSTNGVRWSRVLIAPQPSSTDLGPEFSTAEGDVTTRTTRMGDRTVATVTAIAPGTVVLSAQGRTTCASGKTGCVVRSAQWSWVLRVAAPGTASGTP
jgi:hypothetical protein